ncbi:MAG: 2,3-cyclic 3-phosphodiesterase [Sphingomonadales bacterium]|jgi:2'-5' RNA ligase|nr:2,3-cyclic 3-phosphodiesterase [Sphingomonadales bacterium]
MDPYFRLFFALLPPPDAAAEIGWWRDWSGGQSGPVGDDRLHITFLRIGDFAASPSGLIARLAAIMARLSLPACRIVLDRMVFDAEAARLVASERIAALAAAQRRLRDGLGLPSRARFSPHVTLHYHPGPGGETWIDAISWRATELVLIESVVGRRVHEIRGRWPLRSAAAHSPR